MSLVKIFDNDEQGQENQESGWSMDDVKEYVKQYMVYDYEIRTLQESRRDWSADVIKQKGLPKKELTQALSAAKKELDMGVVNDIYDNISTLVSDD
jgi:hypothetical protein